MPNPASVDDLVARWRPLSSQEANNGETFLDDAWRLLKGKLRKVGYDLETLIAEDETGDLEPEVVRVMATAVLRVMKNPDGNRAEQIDDYSWTRDQAVSAGLLYFTDAEVDDIEPGAGNSGGAYSVNMLSGWVAPDDR